MDAFSDGSLSADIYIVMIMIVVIVANLISFAIFLLGSSLSYSSPLLLCCSFSPGDRVSLHTKVVKEGKGKKEKKKKRKESRRKEAGKRKGSENR
jgi:hypothetical protein